jgi:hypothetical protein
MQLRWGDAALRPIPPHASRHCADPHPVQCGAAEYRRPGQAYILSPGANGEQTMNTLPTETTQSCFFVKVAVALSPISGPLA